MAISFTVPKKAAGPGAAAPGPSCHERGLSHYALFYSGRDDYAASVTAFIRAGLAAGEPVLVAVPEQSIRLLRGELGGISGYVCFADITHLGRNPARIIPAVRAFIDDQAADRVRCLGEPAWPERSAAELQEAVRHEALVNVAFRDTATTVLCLYDADRLPPAVLDNAARTHPVLLRNDQRRDSPSYPESAVLPPDCDQPLPPPPPHAEALSYATDLQRVRNFVASRAIRAGLPALRCTDLILAVSELAANTLRHTNAPGTLNVWRTPGEIVCQVSDSGEIRDPLAGRHRPPPGERGQGLWVVNAVCDLVEIRTGPGGTTIRVHMAIPAQEE